ncbi:sodium channel protein Nach isoform X2 [Cylas formicarius]|uniref:sodium channel protein Nach isoform X2 n=1 Tax=Cylas formicarius TaxID=197179 RepID=UPI0029584005|nr:sodium channel protein Nach isoform X2 [Cylas formicarius]
MALLRRPDRMGWKSGNRKPMARTRRKSKTRTFFGKLGRFFGYLNKSWLVQTNEFFRNSSLHGVRYIAEYDRPLYERALWLVCVTAGTIATLVIIFNLWDKFQTNPTITGLDTDFHTWAVPFPAVILCQEYPADAERIAKVLRALNSSSEGSKEILFYEDLTRLKLNSIPEFVAKYAADRLKLFQASQLREIILQMMNPCEEVFGRCGFKSLEINCCEAFFPVLTESGFCHAFNSRHYETRWNGRKAPDFRMQYIKETDLKWSLDFTVTDQDTVASIYIINSDEMLSADVQPQLVWDFKVNKIFFSVKQTYTTADTRQLSVKQRRCVFEDEIKLEVDEIYTYTACAIQCRLENVRDACACVPHFYPDYGNAPRCRPHQLRCVATHIAQIENIDRCNCQLGCANTVYEVEKLTTAPEGDWRNTTGERFKMEVEFASWPMVRYKREVLFGWVDLLVSFGGIAGLFLGFSLLSGVEIFYYFTVRTVVAAFLERKYLDQDIARWRRRDKSLKASTKVLESGLDIMTRRYRKAKKIKPKVYPNGWTVATVLKPPFDIEFQH